MRAPTVIKSEAISTIASLHSDKGSVCQGASILNTEDIVVHGECSPLHQLATGDSLSARVRHINHIKQGTVRTLERNLARIIGIVECISACWFVLVDEEFGSGGLRCGEDV